jgi:hypothetical protein
MVELVLIATRVEAVPFGEQVQELRQPPRETFGSPNTIKRFGGIPPR